MLHCREQSVVFPREVFIIYLQTDLYRFFYDILLHHYEVTFSRILVIEKLFICPTQMEENQILKTPAQVVS